MPTSLRSAAPLRKDCTGRYVQRKGSQSSSATSGSNNGKVYQNNLLHIFYFFEKLPLFFFNTYIKNIL